MSPSTDAVTSFGILGAGSWGTALAILLARNGQTTRSLYQSLIGDSGSNIEQVEVVGRHEDCSILSFLIKVKDRNHLARILRDVRNMQNVVRVARDCA